MQVATEPIHVTQNTFDTEVLEADIPVVVDFWAPWCGPCRLIGPILDRLAAEYAGRVKVAKLNVDDERELAGGFHIRGIPTLVVFYGGQARGQVVGYRGPQPLEQLFAELAEVPGATGQAELN